MKACSRCGEVKALTEFHRRTGRPCAYVSACKSCKAAMASAYRAANLADVRKRSLDWHNNNKAKSIATTRAWQIANAEAHAAVSKAYRDSTADERHRKWREWRDKNRDIVRRIRAQRRAAMKSAVVPWTSAHDIAAIYRFAVRQSVETGVQHVVDHIVPLQSELVCGLHVHQNLRVIPFLENCSKGNRWWPDMPAELTPDRAPDLSRIAGD